MREDDDSAVPYCVSLGDAAKVLYDSLPVPVLSTLLQRDSNPWPPYLRMRVKKTGSSTRGQSLSVNLPKDNGKKSHLFEINKLTVG